MKVCTTYGAEIPLRKESDMHEIRLDVFHTVPNGIGDNSIITLCGKSIKNVPDWFKGMVDVGDNDVNTEFRTIRSVHDYNGTPDTDGILRSMNGGNHISKGAYMVNSFGDLHRIFEASSRTKSRHVLVGMGATGEITRIRSSLLGNEFTYGYCGTPTAPGQTTAEELERLGDDCMIVGLVGRKLSHSKSRFMQNDAIVRSGINGKYLTFETTDLKHFGDVIREYDIRGVNVTMPFKEEIISQLDDCSGESEEIGAVNTVINDDGKLVGRNTDVTGIEKSISGVIGDIDKVLILGSGGVARAAAFVFSEKGRTVSVVGRNQSTVSGITRDFGTETFTGKIKDYDLVINCTPIGLVEGRYPIDINLLERKHIVFDMVYGTDTPIVGTATKKGCRTIRGEDMLVEQGAESFRLWFGVEPDTVKMKEAIM